MIRLSEEEYRSTQAILTRASAAIAVLELEAFVQTLDEADALGPILEPTAYRRAMSNMRDLRELAVAAGAVKAISLRLQARLIASLPETTEKPRTAPVAVPTEGMDP